MKKITGLFFLFFLLVAQCIFAQQKEPIVLIQTNYGDIKIKLYNETPLHRDNFLKLIEKHFYDSLLFHRVINTFMIQGGDPESKNAPPEKMLGEGDVNYTIPAEFNQQLFHKRGALAGARNGDDVNPLQESSGCQFYIVQGKVFTDSLLDVLEKRVTRMKAYNKVTQNPANKIFFDNFNAAMQQENIDTIRTTRAKIDQLTETEMATITPYKFSEAQRRAYTTIGGTPHLDGSYTVFGEVIEGMDVVDAIAAAPKNRFDRPITDSRILKASVLEK